MLLRGLPSLEDKNKSQTDYSPWISLDSQLKNEASTVTQNLTGPVGPPRIYWSCNCFIGPIVLCTYKFLLSWQEKTLHKIHWQKLLLFILIFIYFKNNLWTFLRGNLLSRMSPHVYWPYRTSRSLFLLARSCFKMGNFYRPEASGSLLASSPEIYNKFLSLSLLELSQLAPRPSKTTLASDHWIILVRMNSTCSTTDIISTLNIEKLRTKEIGDKKRRLKNEERPLDHSLGQQGVFWAPKPLKSTPHVTHFFMWGVS